MKEGDSAVRARELADGGAFADSVVDTVRDPLLVLDEGLRVVRAGGAFYRTFGVPPEDTIGRRVYELGDGQWDIPALRTLLEEVLPRQNTFRDFEVEHRFERIGRRVMLLNARVLRRAEGQPGLVLLAIEDATARRDAENARRDAETRFTEMVQNVRDHSIFLTDADGVITSWNVAAERVIGYSAEEAVGRHFSLIFTPEDIAARLPEWELGTAQSEGRAEDERWHVRKGGERFWALGIVTPLRDPEGAVSGFSKILRDVTGRKRAEEALQASEARFRLVVEGSRDFAMFAMDADGRIASWNAGAERLLGWSEAEAVWQPGAIIFTPEDRAAGKHEEEMATAVRDGRAADERWHVDRAGRRFWGSGVMTAVRAAGGLHFIKVLRDETARKQMEDRLRDSESRLRVSLAAAEMGTWRWDIPSDCQTTDENLTRLLGGGPVETSQPLDAFIARLHPDDRERVRAEFHRAAREGGPFRTEFRVPQPDGTVRWLRDQGDVFRADDGTPLFISGACVDITVLKDAEAGLRAARDDLELRVQERTAELAAALAELEEQAAQRRDLARRLTTAAEQQRHRISRELHDEMGQHLTALILGLKALEGAAPGEPLRKIQDLADEIGREMHRIALELRPTALNDIGLHAALRNYAAEWGRRAGVAVGLHFPSTRERLPPEVETTAYRIVQEALTNVLRHAAATRADVVVRQEPDELVVIVEDDGRGFDPDATGTNRLGIAGMRERATLLGGTVEIESAPGAGTTVFARLPLPEDTVPGGDV